MFDVFEGFMTLSWYFFCNVYNYT